jgi:hypothetical protein
MSRVVLDYSFAQKHVTNPDGSIPTDIPSDASIVDGPGSFQGQTYPKAVQVGFTGPIQSDISSVPISNILSFHVRVVFSPSGGFGAPQTLVNCSKLPFSLYISNEAGSVKLATSINSQAVGLRGTETFGAPTLVPGSWYTADVVYDVDTLVLFLDGTAIACHGFGSNGNLLISNTEKFVTIGGLSLPNRFTGKIAAVKIETSIPLDLEALCDEQRYSPQWYITTKLEVIRLTVDVGLPTAAATLNLTTATWYQPYTRGAILYHSAASSAFILYGFIQQRYDQLPTADKNALGYLVSDEMSSINANGRKSLFQGGAIYWSSATGAFEVLGQMYLDYENAGEASVWGFPLQARVAVPNGFSQKMQNATWYYKNGSPAAHEVHGDILVAFQNSGGVTKWGFPTSDEMSVKGVKINNTDRIVRHSEFEGCSYYWSATTGAHSTYGDIRVKWLELKGPLSPLGLPTTDEMDVPGTGGRMNGYEGGAIVWYGSFASIRVVNPFKMFVGNLNTKDSEGAFMGQNDLYFSATINKGTNTVFRQRYPASGDFGGRDNLDVNIEFPVVLVPDPLQGYTMVLDIWESDGGSPFGGGDDHIGTWVKNLDASNAWGLNESGGILKSGNISMINNITAAVHPQIDVNSLSEVEKWWGHNNPGTDPFSYTTYSQAFRDVDASPEAWDVLDWLDKAFYELVIKHLGKKGNCFGMSLEAIYARKCLSLFSLPLNRFSDWNVTRPSINVKHCYQMGAAPIWWFVGQFLSGNTHDPVAVFNTTRDAFFSGNNPVVCISQNYDFSGAPHCVMPIAWNSTVVPWKMTIHDPNFPGQLRDILVDNRTNTWSYNGGSTYAGGQWSGGRLHYMPWTLLNTAPRTPTWDAIALLLTGTIIVLGSDVETASITDSAGADLSAHGSVATTALQKGKNLNGFFTKAPFMMGDGMPGEFLLTRGNHVSRMGILPGRIGISALDRAVLAEPSIPLIPTLPLPNLEGRLLPFFNINDFSHRVRGKAGGGTHQQLIKAGGTQVLVSSPIDQAESVQVDGLALTTMNASISLTHSRGKDHEITLMHRLGMSQDSVAMRFNLTTSAAGTIKLSPRPGMGLVDLDPGLTKLTAAKLTIASVAKGKTLTHAFDLAHAGVHAGNGLEGPLRMKLPVGGTQLTLASLDGSAIGGSKVLGSQIVIGSRIGNIDFGNFRPPIFGPGGIIPHVPDLAGGPTG